MQGAQYQRSRSGTFHGEFAGFYGLKASGNTQEDCENQLRILLEEWLAYRRENSLPVPVVSGFTLASLDWDVKDQKLDVLSRLDREVQSLKIELLQEPDRANLIVATVRSINRWYKSYWQILVSLASLAIIFVAYFFFNVDPFESYRDTGDKKRMAANFVDIGDQLLLHSGFGAAEQAYQAALGLYPSNTQARYGLFKSQILKPDAGRSSYDIEIAETKLSAARKHIGEDYYLLYVEGVIALDRAIAASTNDVKGSFGTKAKEAFEKSIKLKPEFSGNYLGLGFYELYFLRPKAALQLFETAYKEKHYSPAILIYLGSLNASYRKFDDALKYLTEANTLANRLESLIVLGDIYRYKSNESPTLLDAAVAKHKAALAMANRQDLIKGIDYNELLYTYMPKKTGEPDDGDLIPLPFSSLEHFRVLINYSLSLDYILKGQKDEADKAFQAGFEMDVCHNQTQKEFQGWYKNQITYLINERTSLSDTAKEWLNAKREIFQSCQLPIRRRTP